MPVTPTYPGVYIEEIPSGVRTIAGVSTSVTAFLGYTSKGPTDKAVQIFNYGEFERNFGGLAVESDLSYAVQQFFLNGGSEAWVVRVAKNAMAASVSLLDKVTGGVPVLVVTAASQGRWGNNLRVDVDYDTVNPASLFNLTVTEYADQDGVWQAMRSEQFRNLSMNPYASSWAVDAINKGSNLIRVARPAVTLTAHGTSTSGGLATFDPASITDDCRCLAVSVNGDGPYEFDVTEAGGSVTDLTDVAEKIASAVSSIKTAFIGFTCGVTGNKLVATSPLAGEKSSVHFSNASRRNAAVVLKLGIMNGGREEDAVSRLRPAQGGTSGADLSALDLSTLSGTPSVKVLVQSGDSTLDTKTITPWTAANKPTSLEQVRGAIETALNAFPAPALQKAAVFLADKRLHVVPGGRDPNVRIEFQNDGADTTADHLGLTGAGNVGRYALGMGAVSEAQASPVPGDDGVAPEVPQFKGTRSAKTGLYALEDVDLFNILCIPNCTENSVLSDALSYCEERRVFLIIDLPGTVQTREAAKSWLDTNANLRHRNSAAYWPWIVVQDPLQNLRQRGMAPSGAIAGTYARTDSERGVWKAPAGTDVSLRGVQGLTYNLTDPENGALNPLGLNSLRNLRVYGNVVWGARTLMGADQQASEWKYIPVRRLALYIEESLYRGTKWVVFEPNDEPLWAQIRLNVGAYMHSLFRQGAFQGSSPRDAYLVKCDKETTTQDDVNRGMVNIVVGFAPLKPAEFVILKIQQLAGQIQA